jgi:hypothetical protein
MTTPEPEPDTVEVTSEDRAALPRHIHAAAARALLESSTLTASAAAIEACEDTADTVLRAMYGVFQPALEVLSRTVNEKYEECADDSERLLLYAQACEELSWMLDSVRPSDLPLGEPE